MQGTVDDAVRCATCRFPRFPLPFDWRGGCDHRHTQRGSQPHRTGRNGRLLQQHTVTTFKEVLRRGLQDPDTPIPSLRLTDGLAELRSTKMLDIARAEYPRDSSIVDVFAKQAAACPQAIAVKDSSAQLTYSELDRQSEVLAIWLRGRGFPAETWVGVCQGNENRRIMMSIEAMGVRDLCSREKKGR
jgi:hypothetical protein